MSSNISFRKATLEDTAAIFRLFLFSVRDLAYRQGARAVNDGDDPEVIAATWKQRQSMFEHLTRTARHFWVADRDGTLLGYARSILRHDMLELTEFFVSPAAQSGGIGRELLRLAFADTQARLRTVLASTDVRAQSLYLKSGVYPLFPIGHFSRPAEPTTIDSDLHFDRWIIHRRRSLSWTRWIRLYWGIRAPSIINGFGVIAMDSLCIATVRR